jgi:hypothetical protein
MKKIIGALILIGAVFSAQSAIITFNFTGTNPGQSGPWNTGTTIDPNAADGTGFALGSGITGNSGNNRFNASSWTSASDLATAQGNNDYFGFTITPSSGYGLNLNGAVASFTLQVSSTGPHIYSLVDIIGGGSPNDLQDGTFASGAQTTAFSYTFGSTGNNNITSGVEFRIYGYNASSLAGTMSANAFSLTGSVVPTGSTPVPEPGEWGLISALGLLGLCGVSTWRTHCAARRAAPARL